MGAFDLQNDGYKTEQHWTSDWATGQLFVLYSVW
jgi:hypothetical protein